LKIKNIGIIKGVKMLYLETSNFQLREFWKKKFGAISEFEIHNIKDDDILVLDIDSFNSVQDILEYKAIFSNSLKIIALTSKPKLAQGAYLIKRGFKSYVGTKTLVLVVKQILSSVSNGDIWLYPELLNFIIKIIDVSKISKSGNRDNILHKLTKKEKKVALFISEGLSNKEIADNLDVQLVTIKKHVSSIFLKTGFKDRLALAIALK